MELAHAKLSDGAGTKHVQPREEPAAARGALVRDTLALHFIGEVGIEIVEALAVNRQLVDVIVSDGIANRLVGRCPLIGLLDLLQLLGRDASIRLLRLCG